MNPHTCAYTYIHAHIFKLFIIIKESQYMYEEKCNKIPPPPRRRKKGGGN
jgi:hypothetical protein